jgi:hypothetical protein
MPNPMMVIFTKVNRDPDNFKSINQQQDTSREEMPKGTEICFEEVSEDE